MTLEVKTNTKLGALRKEFPHSEDTIYFNHAATGPLSRTVVRNIDDFVEERHRTSIENFDSAAPIIEDTKERVARLLSTSIDRVEFTPNTSQGLNILARGLDWKEGDRIAVPACEFPANVYPFLNLERRGVTVDFIPETEATFTLDDVEAALKPDTRLLSVSWVQFLSGFRADLAEISRMCRERDILFCVDAIQGLGALQLDVEAMGIDFMACGTQKWILGPQGLGLIYVSEKAQSMIDPPAGWLHQPIDWGNFCDYNLEFYDTAERYRIGMPNMIGTCALRGALTVYEDAGPQWCEEQVLKLSARLREGFRELGFALYGSDDPAHASGIVTIDHPEAEAVADYLDDRSIEIAIRNGLLRFSPTYYNTADEVEIVLEAMRNYG